MATNDVIHRQGSRPIRFLAEMVCPTETFQVSSLVLPSACEQSSRAILIVEQLLGCEVDYCPNYVQSTQHFQADIKMHWLHSPRFPVSGVIFWFWVTIVCEGVERCYGKLSICRSNRSSCKIGVKIELRLRSLTFRVVWLNVPTTAFRQQEAAIQPLPFM